MEPEKRKINPTDYLANERTFLAWLRTSIGIMAFGFVVVKFSLFVKQLSLILDPEKALVVSAPQGHYSVHIGIVLVLLGAFVLAMAYIRYRITNKQLDRGYYEYSSSYITFLTVFLTLISMVLVYYLIKTAQ